MGNAGPQDVVSPGASALGPRLNNRLDERLKAAHQNVSSYSILIENNADISSVFLFISVIRLFYSFHHINVVAAVDTPVGATSDSVDAYVDI